MSPRYMVQMKQPIFKNQKPCPINKPNELQYIRIITSDGKTSPAIVCPCHLLSFIRVYMTTEADLLPAAKTVQQR